MFDGTLDHMINKNIQTMAWAPLGTCSKEKDEAQQRRENALKPLLKKYDADEDELILAWLMGKLDITFIRTSKKWKELKNL